MTDPSADRRTASTAHRADAAAAAATRPPPQMTSRAARRYLQLDVFAERPGAGNALGVVVDSEGLDSAQMQAIARWTNLSETIFLLPAPFDSPATDYRVRIFTPLQELPFAGHPSVGAAWAALDQGLVQPQAGALAQHCAAGVLPVRVCTADTHTFTSATADAACSTGSAATLHVRAPRAILRDTGQVAAALLVAATAGMALGRSAPALWSNGPDWWLVELASGHDVRTLMPPLAAIAALTVATGAVGLCVYAACAAPTHDLVLRAFCPADNIPEDPVTGSANACVAAALAARDALPQGKRRYVASQGREVGRDGRVQVDVDVDGDVWIGGMVQAVIRGTVQWHAAAPAGDPP